MDGHANDGLILERVNRALMTSGEVDAAEITVQVAQGKVILEGSVLDREMAREAEALVLSVREVRSVENRLKVLGSMAA